MCKWLYVAGSLTVFCAAALLVAQAPSFVPDQVFESASFTGRTPLGDAKWSAANGEITGAGAGLLLLDKPISFVPMGHNSKESAGGVVFTEPHASTIADVDGDGIPDFVVAKRYWSHLDNFYDLNPYGAPVLYMDRMVRDKMSAGGARFEPELVNHFSGGGSDVLAVDLNSDGAIDLGTSTRSGTYIFGRT